MPPKKKKGGKKGDDISIEDKYIKALEEIEMLKEHLVVRKELTRRSQAMSEQWKEKMENGKRMLEEKQVQHTSVNAGISMQYKTMQTDLSLRNSLLQMDVNNMTENLSLTEKKLEDMAQQRQKLWDEKEEEIKMNKAHIIKMSTEYESIVMDSISSLVLKMDILKEKWEKTDLNIQEQNKQRLLEFGLNPLDF